MQPDDRLYNAEGAVHMMKYPTRLDDPQEYFDHVVSTKFFQNRWMPVLRRRVTVKTSNHSSAWSNLGDNIIYLPPWAMTDFTLLHEIAHMCAPRPLDHGPKFIAAELALVSRFMGQEAGNCLRHAVAAYGLEPGEKIFPRYR